MAPKGKGGDKGKAADKGGDKKGGAQKGAQSINVRHILCEKHAKKEEALKKLNDGVAFNKVAEEYSEDKARAGMTIFATQPAYTHTERPFRWIARLERQGCFNARVREGRF